MQLMCYKKTLGYPNKSVHLFMTPLLGLQFLINIRDDNKVEMGSIPEHDPQKGPIFGLGWVLTAHVFLTFIEH